MPDTKLVVPAVPELDIDKRRRRVGSALASAESAASSGR